MTKEQEEQFKLYGCSCRCLIAVANQSGNPITKSEFINRYAHDYPMWEKECGGTETSDVLDLARKLGIASHLQIYVDIASVRKRIENAQFVLLFTEKRITEEGVHVDHFHSSLVVRQPTPVGFLVCQVDDEIQLEPPQTWQEEQISEVSGYFGIFY